MATNEKQLKIALVLSAVDKATQVINDSVNKSLKKLDSLQRKADQIASKSFEIGRNAGAIGLAMAVPLGIAVNHASDLEESLSKTDAVFKSNAAGIKQWADGAVAFGQSKQAALEAAATYGNLFQAFGVGAQSSAEMSMTLTQLASDLASFNNTSVEDAILALRSGLSGETEPLKRYGVALSDVRLKDQAMRMGLIATTKEALTPGIKAQAAFALVMRDTSIAQGDFARTSEGLANQKRILAAQVQNVSAQMGTALIPTISDLMSKLQPVITSVSTWIQANPELTGTLMKSVAAAAVLALTVSGLAFVVGGVAKAISIYTTVARAAVLTTGALNKAVIFMNNAFIFGARVYRMTGSVMKAFTAIMRALNVTMLLNPYVAIAMAAIAAAILIYNYWSEIVIFFRRAWDGIKIAAQIAWDWIVKIFWGALEAVKNLFLTYHPIGILIAQWDEIMAFLVGIKDKFFEAGGNIMSSIKDGIVAKAHEAVDAIKGTVQKMRDFLPFSPAKTGPFKDLHRVKIVETIAQAVKPAPLVNAMRAATVAATMALTPGAASAEGVSAAGSSSSVVGGTVSVNYAPVIAFAGNADSPEIRENFTRMLKDHERELLQMIKQAQGREQRRSF